MVEPVPLFSHWREKASYYTPYASRFPTLTYFLPLRTYMSPFALIFPTIYSGEKYFLGESVHILSSPMVPLFRREVVLRANRLMYTMIPHISII